MTYSCPLFYPINSRCLCCCCGSKQKSIRITVSTIIL